MSGPGSDAHKVVIRSLAKRFSAPAGGLQALADVNLAVGDGEFLSIVGPSGCGKSTLLKIIAGLDEPTAGDVVISRGAPDRPLCSTVFQENSVFPWMKVSANVGYGLRMRHVAAPERKRVVTYYLRVIGLSAYHDYYPYQLSGGMKQRVSIARAFANEPEVLLMDEPFASLDEQNRLLLQEELTAIWETHRRTVIFITHSIEEAIFLGDRVAVMSASPGSMLAVLPVGLPRPRTLDEVKSSSTFLELSETIWRTLREEVMKSRG